MHLKTILNLTENHPLFVYDTFRLLKGEPRHRIEIKIRPRKGSSPVCSGCNKPGSGYDILPERGFHHVPLWGIAVIFHYSMRRVQCADCGIKVETVPWASGKQPLTKSFMHVLSHWARKLSWTEVARSVFTSWEQVFHSVDFIVQWGLKHRKLEGITAIGIDEIQWHRGHKYLINVQKSPYITHLESYPNRRLPTDFTDEPIKEDIPPSLCFVGFLSRNSLSSYRNC